MIILEKMVILFKINKFREYKYFLKENNTKHNINAK